MAVMQMVKCVTFHLPFLANSTIGAHQRVATMAIIGAHPTPRTMTTDGTDFVYKTQTRQSVGMVIVHHVSFHLSFKDTNTIRN